MSRLVRLRHCLLKNDWLAVLVDRGDLDGNDTGVGVRVANVRRGICGIGKSNVYRLDAAVVVRNGEYDGGRLFVGERCDTLRLVRECREAFWLRFAEGHHSHGAEESERLERLGFRFRGDRLHVILDGGDASCRVICLAVDDDWAVRGIADDISGDSERITITVFEIQRAADDAVGCGGLPEGAPAGGAASSGVSFCGVTGNVMVTGVWLPSWSVTRTVKV